MELTHESEVLRAGDLEVRPADHLAQVHGRALSLSARELDLLAALVRKQGRIVPREELYATVWGAPLRAHDRSVDVYVHKLRSKLARAVPGVAVHPHALRLRLPSAGAHAFTSTLHTHQGAAPTREDR